MKMNRGIRWTAALAAVVSVMAFSTTAEARPGPHFHGHRGPPPMAHHHHHGGPGFAGALVGTALAVGVLGAIASAAEPEPVVQQQVVYQPVAVQQPVVYQSAPAQQTVVYQQQPVVVQRTVVRRPCCLW